MRETKKENKWDRNRAISHAEYVFREYDTLFLRRYFSEDDLFFDVSKEEIFLHDLGWSSRRYDVNIFKRRFPAVYCVIIYVTNNIVV